MPQLTINGTIRHYEDEPLPPTLAALVDSLALDASATVAEVDGNIVPREAFATCPLADGQTIELVQFVGGG